MTENKRYELTFMDCFYITDHQTKDYSSVLEEDLEEIVIRLNEQHETIQQQKEAIEHLSYDCEYLKNNFEDKCKENEQLKYQNELLSDELEQCKAVINKEWSEYLQKKEIEND